MHLAARTAEEPQPGGGLWQGTASAARHAPGPGSRAGSNPPVQPAPLETARRTAGAVAVALQTNPIRLRWPSSLQTRASISSTILVSRDITAAPLKEE